MRTANGIKEISVEPDVLKKTIEKLLVKTVLNPKVHIACYHIGSGAVGVDDSLLAEVAQDALGSRPCAARPELPS